MSMIEVQINDKETHEYASGITAGDILLNVYGKRNKFRNTSYARKT